MYGVGVGGGGWGLGLTCGLRGMSCLTSSEKYWLSPKLWGEAGLGIGDGVVNWGGVGGVELFDTIC